MIWLIAMALLGWTCVAMMTFVAYRFYRKAVIYDTVFQFIYGDVETNLMQFAKMSKSNILSGDQEIQQAHRNMMLMGKRLEEILSQMEEASGIRLRPPPPPPRPKVI